MYGGSLSKALGLVSKLVMVSTFRLVYSLLPSLNGDRQGLFREIRANFAPGGRSLAFILSAPLRALPSGH